MQLLVQQESEGPSQHHAERRTKTPGTSETQKGHGRLRRPVHATGGSDERRGEQYVEHRDQRSEPL